MRAVSKLWKWIFALVFLAPMGLLFPEFFKAGAAWGEWGLDEIKEMAGYIPAGMEKLASLWNPILPDYSFRGWEEKGLFAQSGAYIFSALAGVVACVLVISIFGKILLKNEDKQSR
jgi:cobalt/nickel transport protein